MRSLNKKQKAQIDKAIADWYCDDASYVQFGLADLLYTFDQIVELYGTTWYDEFVAMNDHETLHQNAERYLSDQLLARKYSNK